MDRKQRSQLSPALSSSDLVVAARSEGSSAAAWASTDAWWPVAQQVYRDAPLRASTRARTRAALARGPVDDAVVALRRHGRDQVDAPRRPQLVEERGAASVAAARHKAATPHRTARRTRHRATTSGVAASARRHASEFRGAPTATSRTATDDVLWKSTCDGRKLYDFHHGAGPRRRAAVLFAE